MLIKEKALIASSEITPHSVFKKRRQIIKAALGLSIAGLVPSTAHATAKKAYQDIPLARIRGTCPLPALKK